MDIRALKVMEFTKPSNVGPLIAAALVGLLALCTDQAFMKPEDIDAFMRRFHRTTASQQTADQPPNATFMLQQLRHGWKAVNVACRRHRDGKPINLEALTELMQRLGQGCNELCSMEAATDGQKSEAQLLYYKALFLAAELAPESFSETFQQCADLLLDQPSLAQRRKFKLLMAFHRCSQGKLSQDQSGLLARLKTFSSQETDHEFAIDLYTLIADDLVSRGLLIPAQQVLEQGRGIYHRSPAKRKLNERLIDIKMRVRR